MSKQTRNIIAVVLCILILALTISVVFILQKDKPEKETKSQVGSSDVSSSITVDDIETEENTDESAMDETKDESDFIEPDETKADKILEENKKKDKNTTSSSSVSKPAKSETKEEKPKSTSSESEPIEQPVSQEETASLPTFEDGKKALADKTAQYLKEHNIDPKTAGETGELCPNCSKKLWNPDKYGSFIPGMPEDYENSGYCLGTCGISFE